jgi:hypothetical protein
VQRVTRKPRAIAMLVTVLMAAVASAVAFSLARATVTESASVEGELALASAQREALSVLGKFDSAVAVDVSAPLDYVLPEERTRSCVFNSTTTMVEPDSVWPGWCPSWSYPSGQEQPSARLEIQTPSGDDPGMTVKVLSRSNGLDAGYLARYTLVGGGRWVYATTGGLDLSENTALNPVTLGGSVYAVGAVSSGLEGTIEGGSIVASESSVTGSLGDVTVFETGGSDIREVAPGSLTTRSLSAGVNLLYKVGCRHEDNIATKCFKPGTDVTDINGLAVTVPEGAKSFMMIPGENIEVWYSGETISRESASWVCQDCDLREWSRTSMSVDKHPGAQGYWDSGFLGEFPWPADGVVAFDGDVQFGVCSSSLMEYSNGEGCQSHSGNGVAGVSMSKSLSVVGDNVLVGAPVISSGGAQVALVARSAVLLPYWMRTTDGDVAIDAHLLGAGEGSVAPSVRSLPEEQSYQGSGDDNWGGALSINGSVTGRNLSLGFAGWNTVTYASSMRVNTGGAPWFAGTDPTWVRQSMSRFSGWESCGAKTCGEVTEVSDEPLPAEPVGLGCQKTYDSITCTWSVGSAVERGTTSSFELLINGAVSWSGTDQSAVVSGLSGNTTYEVSVRAIGSSGVSESDSVSVTTKPGGVSGVSVSGVTYNSADVSWSASVGSLPVSRYVVSWSGDSGASWESVSVVGTTRTITSLTSDTAYQVRVAAVTASGTGGWSSVSAFNTSNVTPPTGVTCSVVSWNSNSLTMNFTVGSNGNSAVTSIEVAISVAGGSSWTTTTKGSGSTSHTFSSLSPGTLYDLKVRANNAIGSSGWCLLNSVPTKPNAVSVTLGAVTTNSAAVSWSSAAGADSYDVYRTRNGTQTLVYSGSGLSYTNTGLTACTSGYVYTVYASGPWGYTSVSNSVTANTTCSGTS